MIKKSFEIQKLFKSYNYYLFYGKNDGAKQEEIEKVLKEKKLRQEEILKQEKLEKEEILKQEKLKKEEEQQLFMYIKKKIL